MWSRIIGESMANQDIGSKLGQLNLGTGNVIFELLKQAALAPQRGAAQLGGSLGALSMIGNPNLSYGDIGKNVQQAFAQGYQKPFGVIGDNEKVMKGLVDKQTKQQASEALQQLGPEQAMQSARNLDMQKMQMSPSQLEMMNPEGRGNAASGALVQYQAQNQGIIPQVPEGAALAQALAGKLQGQTGQFIPPGQTQQAQQPQGRQGFNLGQFLGLDFSKGLMQQGGVTPSGEFVQPSALFGLLRPTGDEMANIAAAYGAQPSVKLRQQIAEAEKVPPSQRDLLSFQVDLLKSAQTNARAGLLKPEELFSKFETAMNPYIKVRDAYATLTPEVYQLALKGDPASQMNTIYSFMKGQSPESSVLGGEFATAENAPGVAQSVIRAYNQTVLGKRVSSGLIKSYYEGATRAYKAHEAQAEKTVKGFAKLGTESGLRPEVFIRDAGLARMAGTQAQQPQLSKAQKGASYNVGRFQVEA